ncbi:vacuolar segregation subunit 7-domain-containing protein [Phaeosphaeriaceae sp. PMI808]|nr:vacuolar segregation subunit 7-domain-containing protein [Phaeosphaeriaceae sp. PMI808]
MNSSDDTGYQSITGALESAEPGASAPTTTTTTTNTTTTTTDTATTASAAAASPAMATTSTTTTTAKGKSAPASTTAGSDTASTAPIRHHHPTVAGTRSLNVSASASPNSPLSSRDASPARPHQRATAPQTTTNPRAGLRSRKSSTDVSPSRGPSLASASSSPSVAAIQRALSAASIPQLSSTSSVDTVKAPRPIKATSGSNSGENTPHHWPISPRLRSPPPPSSDSRSGSHSRRNSLRNHLRKPEAQSTPAIIVQSSSPASSSRIPVREELVASDTDEAAMSIKGPVRGASGSAPKLETVQESSLPATPGFDGLEVDSFISPGTTHKTSDEERNDVSSSKVTEDLSSKNNTSKHTGSGSDSGSRTAKKGKMQEQRSASTQRPRNVTAKPSLSSLSIRSASQQPSRNMTVETETVPSVAQSTMSNQDRSASGRVDGSLRLKPSNETIRPKKEKKTTKRKAPSINAGTASSKADVFEQKVASAVDEANSSDSEATFIYESNPPEPQRSRHHPHSRTPSMTSITSLAENPRLDPRLAIRDAHRNPGKKSSMKFIPPNYNSATDLASMDRGEGNLRIGSVRSAGGHHHINRHGQGRGGINQIVLDSDSSMAQSSRVRGPSSRQASQPNSPRFHTFAVGNGHINGSKKPGEYSAYDDAEHAADDERTPLISSGRSQRTRTPRRRNSVTIRVERRLRHSNGWCRRFAGCLVLSILLLMVIFSSVGLVFATTKPLASVIVEGVQNVIASQDEIMLDLIVNAVNPNIIGVTIADMDVLIFAKSRHLGSNKWWRHHGNGPQDDKEEWKPVEDDFVTNGIDEGTDPIENEPQIMTLGRIFHFDTPLNFDGSFFSRKRASSIGAIRLSNPGNRTETGGIDRWEEVLQHPFELIVQGHFKYQLPLSTREHGVSVTASYYYDPETEKKKMKHTQLQQLRREEEEQQPEDKHKQFSNSVLPRTLGRYDRRANQLPASN